MIIFFKLGTKFHEIEPIKKMLESKGIVLREGMNGTAFTIGLIGDVSGISEDLILNYPCVEKVTRVKEPYFLAGRTFHSDDSTIEISGKKIGGGGFVVIAGPCAVESKEQMLTIAKDVKSSGAGLLRGGAFKPRTSPHAFNGLGLEGLEILKNAKRETGLPIVTEIMSSEHLDLFFKYVDIIQIGSRNMQNFSLLRQVGSLKKPVLLKRGLSATIDELLMAAEHIMVGGSHQIILCERGIRTFETTARNTLDLSAIPILKEKTHLPVIVDPSHGTGYSRLVEPMAMAAVAAGCDGLIIEVHNNPEAAMCDGAQSITPQVFERLMRNVTIIRNAVTSEVS